MTLKPCEVLYTSQGIFIPLKILRAKARRWKRSAVFVIIGCGCMKYKKQSHTVYYTRYHYVISTKYRRKVLVKGMGEYLKRKVQQIKRFHPEIDIIKVNNNIDHMHIMVSIPPKMSVSSVVRLIKTNTGKAMMKHF